MRLVAVLGKSDVAPSKATGVPQPFTDRYVAGVSWGLLACVRLLLMGKPNGKELSSLCD